MAAGQQDIKEINHITRCLVDNCLEQVAQEIAEGIKQPSLWGKVSKRSLPALDGIQISHPPEAAASLWQWHKLWIVMLFSLKACDSIPPAGQFAFLAQEIFAVKMTRRKHEPSVFQSKTVGTPGEGDGYEKLIHWLKIFYLEFFMHWTCKNILCPPFFPLLGLFKAQHSSWRQRTFSACLPSGGNKC